ncbi:hypothetical protein [Frondihabitans australicus]|uniref:Uncharacterized protein n=1 Tax=Frondihabitans australicus TaxID=386892 RepID=A0A495IG71_9MICO|nr:hypothetical protein [Frondihabitans australicus]RKR74195.1 hypothetical protein C8E83_1303 [Frondihabitans australicus]
METRRILIGAGRTVARTLATLGRALTALGSGGGVSPLAAPPPEFRKRDDYRP